MSAQYTYWQDHSDGMWLGYIRPLDGYGDKIAITGDIFADDSSLWENA